MRGRRSHALALALLVALLGAAAVQAKPTRSWAQPEIARVVAGGLMAPSVAEFRPEEALLSGELAELLPALAPVVAPAETAPAVTDPTGTTPTTTATLPAVPVGAPEAKPITLAQLDASLVRAVGGGAPATSFTRAARAAGLRPPARFGTEVVARLLQLRTNHPAAQDELELRPQDTITRAETAYSVAQILGFRGYELQSVANAATTFELPTYDPWQLRILQKAVSFVGYPYIWGGTTPGPEAPFGHQSRGGFDCSGFVWQVYKRQRYAGSGTLTNALKGRTTYQMSGEVKPVDRIPADALQPADVIFFGAGGPRAKPAQINHMGIYLGNGWFIHSSGQGVAINQLLGWYAERLAWGRRPLAEAGLVPRV